jgi:hypothetical protein
MWKPALILCSLPLLFACNEDNSNADNRATLSSAGSTGLRLPYSVMRTDLTDNNSNAIELRNGGYGSAATINPLDHKQFYAMTDRGPNGDYVDGAQGEGKLFPTPDYTPRIGLFEIRNGAVVKVKDILLKDRNGNPVTGLPNSAALGGTGEIPYDAAKNPIVVDPSKAYNPETNPIKYDDYGIDSEGLVALQDGTFWVSDEYGPHMVHFDQNGKEIGRINAFSNDARSTCKLPAEFIKRRANRGMEGLAITPDQKTLVGIMQSTIYNPDSAVKKSDITRIVSVNTETCAVKQYLYQQDAQGLSNSEIAAISADTFIVLERDGDYLSDNPATVKKVYKITLSSGTELENLDISADASLVQNGEFGLTLDGKTLEQVVYGAKGKDLAAGWAALALKNIVPVHKELVIDMALHNYPHDKMESLLVIDAEHLGLLNDDDFAIGSNDNGDGGLFQKTIGSDIDGGTLYVVEADLSPVK